MSKQNKQLVLLTELLSTFLKLHGEDLSREGLQETPNRICRMYKELLCGYLQNPKDVFKTFDSNGYQDLVTVTNIQFYSLCEHHMIPFFGKVHIGYVPNGRVLGLSKFARLTEILSHRLQTQENFTQQIANELEVNLKPEGLIVSVEGEHLCMAMRGIKKPNCITKTTTTRGSLKKEQALVDQFYREIVK